MSKTIYKNLIKKLLEHYIEKASQSNELYRYVVLRTPDDNLSLFEKLSINNQIGIYTNLSDFDAKIMVSILESIYSKNYGIYQKSYIQDILYDSDITNEDFGLEEMLDDLKNNYVNLDKWIEYLELIPSKYEDDENEDNEENMKKMNDYIDKYGTDIDNLQIFENLPEISKYFKLKHQQKFYSLDEISNI